MEIPVIHEKSVTSDSSISSARTGYLRSLTMPFTASMLDRQGYIFDPITSNQKAEGSTKSTTGDTDDSSVATEQGFRPLHARLPSTDSGIQADAGFDSLSRYKGKHLISSTAKSDLSSSVSLASLVASSSPPLDRQTSKTGATSPQETCSSGYCSDVWFSSSSSPSAVSRTSPSFSSSPLSSISSSRAGAITLPTNLSTQNKAEIQTTPSSVSSGGNLRQTSVPVAPKPRVPVSRKPAFIGRGVKQSQLGGETGVNTTPSTSMSLSAGIKVVDKEDGVEVSIRKPTIPPKSSATGGLPNGNIINSSTTGRQPSRLGENSTSTSSHNSTIDILSSDGSSVKIHVVKPGLPSSSSPSSSYSSSPLSTSPLSHASTYSESRTEVKPTPSAGHNVLLTRPLRINLPQSNMTTTSKNARSGISNSHKASPPSWRATALSEPLLDTSNNLRQPQRPNLSENRSIYQNELSNSRSSPTSADPTRKLHNVPIRKIEVPHFLSNQKSSSASSVGTEPPRTISENSCADSNGLNTQIPPASHSKYMYGKGTGGSPTTDTASKMARDNVRETGDKASPISPGASMSPTSPIDSCTFRFKSPETSIFKQTFYDKRNQQQQHSQYQQQQQHSQQQQQPQPSRSDQNTFRPTPNSTRFDFLRKPNLRPKPDDINFRSRRSDRILKHTDAIVREALDLIGSSRGEDDKWGKMFSGSDFMDDEEFDKFFSKSWKRPNDDFDRVFNKIFKQRSENLEVDPRVGVSVDEDNNDANDSKTVTSDKQSLHSTKITPQARTGLDGVKPLDVTSLKCGMDINKSHKSQEKPDLSPSDSESLSWKDRKHRMDSALSWLQHELADLRAMDKRIVSQFRRCQDVIESLQAQREVWEGLEEEGEYWDDMEISEYNRRCQESPESCSLSPVSTGSHDISMTTNDHSDLPFSNANPPKPVKNGSGFTQDVEATL